MLEEKKRNVGIELFRILMMLGIVMSHICAREGFESLHLHSLMPTGVVGFAMISGYFGIRFAPSKLIRLYALAIGYCFLIPLIGGDYTGWVGYLEAVRLTWISPPGIDATTWFWYLHSYAILMCIVPLLDEKRMKYALPLLGVVFGWSFLVIYRHGSLFLPRPIGFSAFSFLTLLGIYLATRLARQNGWFEKLPVWILCGVVIVSAAIIFVVPGAGANNSPVALVWIFVLFSLFLRIRSLGKLSAVIYFIAPSMFGIYLIHCVLYFPGIPASNHGLINTFLHNLSAARVSLWANYILTMLGVFGLSLAVEIVRRLLLKPLMPKINAGLKWIDTAYQGFVERTFK